MTVFDVKKALRTKKFYRFTGPPENWLTAIKYMTWGLEEKYENIWKQISIGDVFLMHSMATKSLYKKVQSVVVGLGVVGGNFRRKDNFLWIHEIKRQQNIWPLLIPFSEIYLFSSLPPHETWEAPGIGPDETTQRLIDNLLSAAIPLRALGKGEGQFPVMGSTSGVRIELVDRLFSIASPTLYNEFYTEPVETPTEFIKIRDAEATMRYVPTLKFLEGSGVKIRRLASKVSTFERDNALLERAEEEHARILQAAIDFFQNKGFETWNNQHVDLLAESENQAFLVEVKSTTEKKFRTQARRAVGQLFEYEYFDIRKYFAKKQNPPPVSKVLMPSGDPKDSEYTNFLNTLKVHLAWPMGTHIKVAGDAGKLASLLA